MRSTKRLVRVILPALIAGTCFAQVKSRDSRELLTRISYRSTYGGDWRGQEGSPQICFALYRSGYYRLSRLTEFGAQAFQGTLAKDQVSRVGEMFKKLKAQHREDGIIREGSESVVVEVAGKEKRYAWVDADHRSPFPESVFELVRWLQGFNAEDAAPLTLHELSDQPICPPASEKLLQPTVAGLSDPSDTGTVCGGQRGR